MTDFESNSDNYGSFSTPSRVHFANIQEENSNIPGSSDDTWFSTKNWNTKDFYSLKPLGTPSYRAGFNVIATVVGAGILGIPYAIQQGGWTGIIVLCVVGFMANYTGRMLIKAMYSQKRKGEAKLATYFQIGVGAFGYWGGVVVMITQYMVLISAGILFLILAGLNEKNLFEQWGVPSVSVKAYVAANVAIVIFPVILLKTMKEISIIALIGVVASTFVAIVIVILGAIHPDKHASHKWIDLQQYPYAFATIVFSFGGHSVFPTIQHHMRSTKHFNRMFNVSFLIIMAMYLPPAIAGYWAFGDNTQSPILMNLKQGGASYAATIAITMHVLLVIPLLLNPVALDIEGKLGLNPVKFTMDNEGDITEPQKTIFQKFEFPFRAVIRTTLLCAQAGIALLVPHFADFMALVGASCVTGVVFFIPCSVHLKINWARLSVIEVLFNLVILEAAWIGSTVGILQAVTALLNDIFHLHLVMAEYVFWIVLANSAALGVCVLLVVFGYIVVGWVENSHKKRLRRNNPLNKYNALSSSSSSSSSSFDDDNEERYMDPLQ